ncbi:hypothetical protein [Phytohabitans houttuyneae]|uniref:hypothetical protein n=1 Tax=Phytohabitans houttuyneae TaxID=1076126 RepID=UPI00156326E0|nr:hypothetical protein [Phytohabitans houttuyneae]
MLLGCLLGVGGACVVGAGAAYWAGSRIGLLPGLSAGAGLGAMAVWLLVVLAVVAGHVGCSWWAWRVRPGRKAVVLTQVPHVVVYVGAVAWWSATWTALYLLWIYATLSAVAWLTVWFLRNPAVARRAVVYLSALGLLVAVNTAGLLSLSWQRTNGFGLRGQSTPWAAFTALTATSCLTRHPFYTDGTNTIAANCPTGPDADFFAGAYDQPGFADTLCGEQPRQAFSKWWQWNREYQVSFTLDWAQEATTVDHQPIAPPYPETIDGATATIQYTLNVENVSTIGADRPHQMRAPHAQENWTVHFEPVTLGGWKVCRIDITNPITATFTPQ